MTRVDFVLWALAAAAPLAFALSVHAALYFHRQGNYVGGSWILTMFMRTTATIAVASVWLTVASVIQLIWDFQPWTSIVTGLAVLWLLMIPLLLEYEFRKHEGREPPYEQK